MNERITNASYGVNSLVVLGSAMSAQAWGVLFGVLFGAITMGVSVWAKLREDRRQARLTEAQLEALRRNE